MILLANLLLGVGKAFDLLLSMLLLLAVVRVVLSWVNPDPMNIIVRIVTLSTEPFLRPLRRVIPSAGGLDLSVIAFFMAVVFLQYAVAGSMIDYAFVLKRDAMLAGAP